MINYNVEIAEKLDAMREDAIKAFIANPTAETHARVLYVFDYIRVELDKLKQMTETTTANKQ